MAREERKGPSLRRKLALAAVAFFFLVLLISTLFGKKGLIEIYRAKKNYEALLLEVQSLEVRKNQLQKEIEEFQNDPAAVEKEAREKLWLIKPDEKVVVRKKEEKR
ncbi:MAG: septum formation initiator family protein [Candidatus Aminicenantes bacterium]|nr:septum formation initiator family protein [Candidatus Aminicenantes bacterium]